MHTYTRTEACMYVPMCTHVHTKLTESNKEGERERKSIDMSVNQSINHPVNHNFLYSSKGKQEGLCALCLT